MFDLRGTRAARLAVTALGLTLLVTPAAVAATIEGTAGNDRLRGTNSADTIFGHAGNDDIDPGRGDDRVYGGEGIDDIWVSGRGPNDLSGADRVYGGPGIDFVYAGPGDVAVLGKGNDGGEVFVPGGVIFGGPGRDTMWAEAPGRFHFGPGADLACGGSDSHNHPGRFRYWLGEGDDRAFGDWRGFTRPCSEMPDSGNDTVWAGGGDDTLWFGADGRDKVYAGPGNDSIRVRNIDHRVVVCGPGRDVLTLIGRAGPPVIEGCERIVRK